MCDQKIITHCAPTLAGIKTANLFADNYESLNDLYQEIKEFNLAYKDKGLIMIPIQCKNKRALIYVYRTKHLKNDLHNDLSEKILQKLGYDTTNLSRALSRLKERLSESEAFPHEIGLFLGYPPEDVLGFIENKAKNYKVSGYWKVYGDEEKAIGTFNKFRKCAKVYQECYKKGFTFQKLIVNNI